MWHWLRSIVRRQHERKVGRRSAVLKHTRYASRPVRATRLLLQALEERTVPTVSVFDSSNHFIRNYSGADAVQQGIGTPSAATLIVYNDEYYADFVANVAGQSILGRDVNTTYGTFQFQGDGNVAALGSAVAPVGNAPATQPTIIASGTGTTVTLTGSGVSIDNLNIVDGNGFNPVGVLVSGNNETITNSTIELHDRGVVVNAGVNGLEIANSSIIDNTQEGIRFNGGTTTQNVSIHNDFITGNVTSGTATFAGVRFAPTYSGNNVNFFYDDLSGNGGSGAVLDQSTVANSAGKSGDVNFSFDWWGSASGPSGATIGGIVAPGTGAKVSNRVDVTPYLISGDSDSNPSDGFQPSLGVLDVTKYDVQTGTVGRIQEAVTGNPGTTVGVNPGGIINVGPGTFQEADTVPKAVSLRGANFGVAGSGTRGTETVVIPNGNQNALFLVTANNVTIDGFTINGDDPAVTGGSLTSGADSNALYGVQATSAASNVVVQNDIVKDVAIGFRGDGASSGNLITRDWFDSIGAYDFGYAVTLRTNFYADVTNNLMTRVQSGLQTNNFFGATGPATWLFQGNTVQAYGAGVWDNLQYNGATSLTINNNTITSLVAPTTPANAAVRANFDGKSTGILLVSIQDAVGVNITNNTINGMGYGLVAYNTVTSNTVTPASSNTIENSTAAGVYLTNIVGFNPVTTTVLGGTANNPTGVGKVNLTGLALTGNATGVLVRGDNAATPFGVSLTLGAGDTITGGLTGLQLSGGMAAVTGGNLNNLAFSGQTGTGWRYITLTGGALSGGELNATAASFDGFVGSAGTLPTDLATFYSKEDRIDDAIDAPGVGFVRLKSGNVFVTQQSDTTTPGSIQRGVDAASAGDTVNVQGGTYSNVPSGDSVVNIDKGVTVLATDGPAATTIDGNSASGNYYVVIVSASNATLSGFTITNAAYSGTADASGIVIESPAPAHLSNVRIADNIIHDIGSVTRSAAFATLGVNAEEGIDGLEIDHNTIYNIGNADASGFAIGILTAGDAGQEVDGANIHDNTIYNVSNPSLAAAIDAGSSSQNITIQNNTIGLNGVAAGPVGYGIRTGSGASGTVSITSNTIANATVAGIALVSPFAETVHLNTVIDSGIGIDVQAGAVLTSATNNLLTGNGTGILIESGAGSVGPINLNSIAGNTVGLDNETTSGTVDASHDWWGSANGPTNASNPVNVGMQGDSVVGPGTTNFTPWLTSGQNDAAGPGFVPHSVASFAPVTNDEGGGFLTIQSAVNGTDANHTIFVSAGTYHENVTVNKALTIDGANAGVAGSASRGAESIVETNGNQNAVFTITSSNVTIDGFTVEGDDPNVTGVSLTSGADANAAYGFRANGSFSNLAIQNNIVKDVEIGFRGDGSASANLITRNWFDSIGIYDFGYAVSLRNNFYADVTNNLMTRVQSGLHTNNFFGATGPASWLFQGNTVQAYGAGVWDNLQYNGATSLTIDNNHITSLVAPTTAANSAVRANFDGKSTGILLVSIQDAVGANITNNTIDGMGYGLIAFNTPTSNTITVGGTNTIENSTAAGVYLTNIVGFNPVTTTVLGGTANNPTAVGKLALSGLALTNNATGVLVRGDNPSTPFGVSLTVGSGDSISGGTTGLAVTGSNTAIAGNTLGNLAFSGQTNYIVLSNGAENGQRIDATGASFDGLSGATATLPQLFGIEDKITHSVDTGFLGAGGVGFVRVKAGNVYVTQNSGNIQYGVDSAVAGDTVNVQAGTFVGQVAIDKDLTLQGAGANSTTIEAPATMSTSFTSVDPYTAIVTFQNTTAGNISGFTVDGAQKGNGNFKFAGVAYHNAGGTASDLTVEGVSDNPLDGSQHGYGIVARDDNASVRTVAVTDNTIFGYQKNGVDLRGTGLTADVGGNTITGAGPTATIGQNGVVLGFGAGGSIHDNIISGNSYTPTLSSAGVLLYQALATSSVTGNTISGSDYGIYSYAASGPGTTVISGNTVSGAGAAGVSLDQGAYNVAFNTLQNGADGIDLYDNLTGTTIRNNLIQNSTGTGILVAGPASGYPVTDSAGPLTISFNSISGNATAGLDNESAVTVNAANNWWGSANGPTNPANTFNVGSQGDKIVGPGTTTFVPWLASGQNNATGSGFVPAAGASFAPVTNDEGGFFSSIQAGINGTDPGHTVFVSAGTFSENVNVNKSLTIDGAGSSTSGTIVHAASGNVITVSANNVTLDHLRITGTGSTNGVFFDSAVNGTTLSDVVSTGHSIALEIHNSAVVTNLTLTNVDLTSSVNGFRVATTGQVSGMTVTGGNFSNNQYGLYTNADLSSIAAAAANVAGFQHVAFSGTTFANNSTRAIYLEKANDVTFSNVTVTANESANVIDVNLKNGAYAGLHFNGGSVTNAGTGTDLYIKGRNDGGNASTPGSLTDVTLHNLTITSGGTDVAFQNNVTLDNSALSGLTLNGTGTGIGFFGSDAASTPDMPSQTFALNDTNFAGSLAAYVVDTTHNNVDGTAATYGGIAGGNTLTVANGFAIADKIVDGVDASTNGFNSLGLVRLRAGQVYVTPNSFYAPLGTTAASIQRGVNVASANDTLNVEAGTYTGDILVNKSLTLLGAQAGVDPVPGRAGAESIIMGAGVHAPVQIAAGTNNVVIDGFTIQSPAGGSGDLNAGIWTNGSTGLTIRYDIIQNNTAGIAIGDSGGSIAHNVIRTNNGPGPGGGNGVEFFTGSGSSGWTVSNNLFTGNNNADVQIAAGATVANVVITANQFVNSTGNPLYALQADNLTFSGNTITGAAFSGVYLGGEVTNSSITGNTFTNNHSRAIYAGLYPGLTANANVTISGNTITQDATLITSPRAMIDLEAGAGVTSITGNTIAVSNLTTQQITGIGLIGTGASSVLIQNNTIKGTADGVSGAKTGISIGAGSTATLLGNTIHGGTGTGRIGVTVGGTATLGDDTAGGANVITGWSGSNADGVQVTAAGAATLLMNTITGNNFGVIVDGGKALLQDNDLRNNKTNGISSAGLDVRNNAMVDAGQDNPATATVEGTNFTGLGISKGGNLFNWASTPAGGYSQSGAKAIVNENDFSGTLPTDAGPVQAPNVPAQYNNFGTTVYGNIEQIVFHYYDSGKALVDYRNAVGATAPTLEVVSPGSINPLLRVFAVDPTVNAEVGLVNQRSIIRAIQFQVDSPVALSAGAVDLTRVGAASYPWYASALPTGAVPISTEADIDGSTGRTTITVRYTTPNTGAFNGSMTEWGSLVDGNYNLGFHGAAAELLFVGSGTTSQDHTESLFRFYGDTNGTRTLNSADTAVLRLAIANQPNDPTRFLDLNQNGAIDPFESQDNAGNPAAAGEYFRRLRQGAFLPPSP